MDLEIKPDPDIDPDESLRTDGKEMSEEGVRLGSGPADDGVIVLTDAVDATGKNDADRGPSERSLDIPINNTDATVSSPELEKTLERVVDKLFTQKIEGMIADIINRALNREIAKLKRALLDDESKRNGKAGS